jgi:predicted DCC family thiol-disulfide oxidoreductase YuxK
MQDDITTSPLTCFHDGDCPICRVEINAMKKLDNDHQKITWVDISKDHDTLKESGLSYEQAMAKMYVLDSNGFKSGVDGFLLLWSQLPYYRRLIPVVNKVPLVKPILSFFYGVFARYRFKLTGKG